MGSSVACAFAVAQTLFADRLDGLLSFDFRQPSCQRSTQLLNVVCPELSSSLPFDKKKISVRFLPFVILVGSKFNHFFLNQSESNENMLKGNHNKIDSCKS